MAFSWVYLNRVFEVRRWLSLFSAALFVILSNRFDMAGEWVVGGFEGKSITYALVVLAVGLYFERKWNWFWPVIGLACAFHAIVGIWALLCFAAASLTSSLLAGLITRFRSKRLLQLPKLSAIGLFPLTLFSLGLVAGCYPPLASNWDASSELVGTANYIQVHERLSHHQLFQDFPASHVGRFLLLVLFWLFMTRWLPLKPMERKLTWFCNASLLVSLAGIVLSGVVETPSPAADRADWLLRFYWFRFSDFAIPLGVALLCTRFTSSMLAGGGLAKRRIVLASLCCLGLASGLVAWEGATSGLSPADQRSLPDYPNDPERTINTYSNWRKVCRWISLNTDQGSLFVTPVEQQTFKWHAERAEVACWKDMPQDAAGVVEWRQRVNELRGIEAHDPAGYFALTSEQLKYLVEQYQVTHLLLPQSMEDAANENESVGRLPLEKIYPKNDEERSTYVVYRLREESETPARSE